MGAPHTQRVALHPRACVRSGAAGLFLRSFSVVAVQYRTPLLDAFFTRMTFVGEEEFYLLALPWLFWNIEHKLGTQATLVVCTGIFSGNFLKDMFHIPRPPRDKVWVSPKLVKSDSTGLKDFGFPSTHSLNAFSNPAFVIVYYLGTGALSTERPGWLALAVLAGTAYGVALAISRLYLGVHSPSDVRAGLFMGVVLIATYGSIDEWLYRWVTTADGVVVTLIVGTVLLLVLSPQPRVRTPTFMQNCSLMGLLLGDLVGSRFWFHQLGFDEAAALGAGVSADAGTAGTICGALGGLGGSFAFSFMRFFIGLLVVLAMRAVGKLVINNLLRAAFKVKLFDKEDTGEQSSLVVLLEAFSKTTVYTGLALGVTIGAPLAHHALGLSHLSCF